MGKKETIENLEQALAEANERAHRNARDVDYYRNRETARARAEHAERQRKLKQAERAARLERIEHIGSGRLPLDGAESVSITHEGDEVFVDVTVKLTKPEHQAVQDYLGRTAKKQTPADDVWETYINPARRTSRSLHDMAWLGLAGLRL